MRAKSHARGKSTLPRAEVVQISPFGIWLHVDATEYFLDYEHYPWFQKATVQDIHEVELLHETHLHWPNLDIDLDLLGLKHPEAYPLCYQD